MPKYNGSPVPEDRVGAFVMTVSAKPMTALDLAALPGGRGHHELVRGELRTTPPTGRDHGFVESDIFRLLANYVEEHELGFVTPGDCGYLVSRNPDTVRAPDVGFISAARAQAAPEEHYWPLAPDLAVEVLSPSDTTYEVDEKTQDWLAAGSRAVWIVNPRQRTILVYQPASSPVLYRAGETLNAGDVVPGFRLKVDDAFAKLTANTKR